MFNTNEPSDLLLDEIDTVAPLDDEGLEEDEEGGEKLDVGDAEWDKEESE